MKRSIPFLLVVTWAAHAHAAGSAPNPTILRPGLIFLPPLGPVPAAPLPVLDEDASPTVRVDALDGTTIIPLPPPSIEERQGVRVFVLRWNTWRLNLPAPSRWRLRAFAPDGSELGSVDLLLSPDAVAPHAEDGALVISRRFILEIKLHIARGALERGRLSCGIPDPQQHLVDHPDGGGQYFDHALEVLSAHPLDAGETAMLLAAASGSRLACSFAAFDRGLAAQTVILPAPLDFFALESLAERLSALDFVVAAGPALVGREMIRVESTDTETAFPPLPVDPHWYGLVQLQGAYEYARTFREQHAFAPVELAIVDSGICASPECAIFASNSGATLPASIASLEAELPDLRDGSQEMLADDFPSTDPRPLPPVGLIDWNLGSGALHGTMVAGLAAGTSNGTVVDYGLIAPGNGVLGGVQGLAVTARSFVAPGIARGMVLPGYEEVEPELGSNTAAYLTLALACRSRVVNNSWGFTSNVTPDFIRTVQAAIAECGKLDALVLFSAGNEGQALAAGDKCVELAAPNLACVGAVEWDGQVREPDSNFGPEAVLAANSELGTSLATPIASGAAGLALALDPGLSAPDLLELLRSSGSETAAAAGARLVDLGSVVLRAAARVDPDFVPMSLQRLETRLAPASSTERVLGGDLREDSAWDLSDRTLTISRTLNGSAPLNPVTIFDRTDIYDELERGYTSRLESALVFRLGSGEAPDDTLLDRRVPTLDATQAGEQSYALGGAQAARLLDRDRVVFESVGYCGRARLSMSGGAPFRLPLGMESHLSNLRAELSASDVELTLVAVRDEELEDEPDLASAAEPSCLEDPTASIVDNTAEFEAWVEPYSSPTGETSFGGLAAVESPRTTVYVHATAHAQHCEIAVSSVENRWPGFDAAPLPVAGFGAEHFQLLHLDQSSAASCTVDFEITEVVSQTALYIAFSETRDQFPLHTRYASTTSRTVRWDPAARAFPFADLLADTAFAELVRPEHAAARHLLPAIGHEMGALEWAPGIGPLPRMADTEQTIQRLDRLPR